MRRARFASVGVLLTVVACSSEPATPSSPAESGALPASFDTAAVRANVPRELLVAIAVVEDGLSLPARREVDPDATIPIAGPLQLRRGKLDTLALGAKLSGHAEVELRADADLALAAGALVVAEVGRRTGAKADDLATWERALEEIGGFADDAHRVQYAHNVLAVLARGGTFVGRDGDVVAIAPHDLPPHLVLPIDTTSAHIEGAEYPGAEWFPTSCTNKCDTSRGGNAVDRIVVHDTEGGWSGSVATLQNDPGKSVQYIVNTDGHVGQFVPESYTAWHAGNYYYNQRSVGIEHVGYYNQPYPEALYASSAKLVDYLAKKYSVARDRAHIIGHDQVPNGNVMAQSSAPCSDSPKTCETGSGYGGAGNHRDPGDWEWCLYMPRFGGSCKCNDVYNLWNCSADKTHAMRCVSGKVEVALCDGPGACESKPLGQDDVCHELPKPDAGAPDASTDAASDASALLDASTADAAAIAPPPMNSSKDSGCSCSTTPGSRASSGWLVLAAAALLARARRRQS